MKCLKLFVWPGHGETAERVVRHAGVLSFEIVRVDTQLEALSLLPGTMAAALIDMSAVDKSGVTDPTRLFGRHMPVICIADPPTDGAQWMRRVRTLRRNFTQGELEWMLNEVVNEIDARVSTKSPDTEIAYSTPMRALLDHVDLYADSDAGVVVCGEVGTGKKWLARRLHAKHPQYGQGSFVMIHCDAISDHQADRLFFGQTSRGDTITNPGYFEQASGGTLFLNEVTALSPYWQTRLLRVLTDKSIVRDGDTHAIPVNFRVMAASKQSLRKLVDKGNFRVDLYYRLAVVECDMPNLEARGIADKIALFKAFIGVVIGPELQTLLYEMPHWITETVARTHFPGNAHELRNFAERIGTVVRKLQRWDENCLLTIISTHRIGSILLWESSRGRGAPPCHRSLECE
jgi:DNA-binding NtrC family response regulator